MGNVEWDFLICKYFSWMDKIILVFKLNEIEVTFYSLMTFYVGPFQLVARVKPKAGEPAQK